MGVWGVVRTCNGGAGEGTSPSPMGVWRVVRARPCPHIPFDSPHTLTPTLMVAKEERASVRNPASRSRTPASN